MTPTDVRAIAEQMLQTIAAARAALRDNLVASLRDLFGVQVQFRPIASREGLCPVDGTYVPGPPAMIIAGQAASPGRRRFTLAHEFGHLVIDRNVGVALEVAQLPNDARVDVVEQVCNAFAADLLMPRETVPAQVIRDGPHPQDVVTYAHEHEVSRSAAAARLAPCLPGAGWILVVGSDGRVIGAASHGDAPTVVHGVTSPFRSATDRALEHGRATDTARATFATGTLSASEYHVAAVRDRGVVVVVATVGRAPWVKLHLLRQEAPQGTPTTCVRCDEDFEGMGRRCEDCGDFVHKWGCGRCSCGLDRTPEVICKVCSLVKNAEIVTDGVCRDCQ